MPSKCHQDSGGEGTEMQGVGRVQSNKGSLGERWEPGGLGKSPWGCEMMDEFPSGPRGGHNRGRHGQKPSISSERACFFGGPTSQLFVCFLIVFTAKGMQM